MGKPPAAVLRLAALACWLAAPGQPGASGAPAGRTPPPDPLFVSASLRLSLTKAAAVCEGRLSLVRREATACSLRIPLPPGRLARQASGSGAALALAEPAPRTGAGAAEGWVQLPGAGTHHIDFELHLAVQPAASGWEAAIPHPGATVCRVDLLPAAGIRLDRAPLPQSVETGSGLLLAFPPSPQPLRLGWQAAPEAWRTGIARQHSRFDFTAGDGEVRGRLELRATCDTPVAAGQKLHCSLPPGCFVARVESAAAASWQIREQGVTLELRGQATPEVGLILHTVTPFTSAGTAVALPLPRLQGARQAEGLFTLQNGSAYAVADCQVPAGFLPAAAPSESRPSSAYRFFSLEDGATAAVTLVQPHARIHARLTTTLHVEEAGAQILRRIRLQAESGPAFSGRIRIPADETLAEVRLIEGEAELRRELPGVIDVEWSRGLRPGESATLETASLKTLYWNHGTALLRLEPPALPGERSSGTLELQAIGDLLVRPVRNPRLRPLAAADLPAGAAAAWNHAEFDALVVELGKRPSHRSAVSVARAKPSLSSMSIAGELAIDPGDTALEEVELTLERADAKRLRFPAGLLRGVEMDPAAGILRLALKQPQTARFALPWSLSVPPLAAEAQGPGRSASFEVPQVRPAGFPLQSARVEVFQEPFSTLRFEPKGFEPSPVAGLPGQTGRKAAAAFAADRPDAALRVTCEELGRPSEAPWEIESFELHSRLAALAPHRHRCELTLPASAAPRMLPLVLPPSSTLLSLHLAGSPVLPLESPARPREILIPLPAAAQSLRLRLDYFTRGPAWVGSGDATLTPPVLPDRALTRQCRWSLQLPPEFDCSDFDSSLAAPEEPAAVPITLRPLLTWFHGEQAPTHPSLTGAWDRGRRQFQGDFTPAPLSFHYVHIERQGLTAVLWVLAGVAAFWVFARERPFYLGAFGLLLLTFLPLSGLAPFRTAPDGLLLGWLAGAVAFALRQLIVRGRTSARQRGAWFAPLLLPMMAACPPQPATAAAGEPLFREAVHRVKIAPGELRVVSTYAAAEGASPAGPLTVGPLRLEPVPPPAGFQPGTVRRTFQARYRVPVDPANGAAQWEIPPAAAALLLVAGVAEGAGLAVNGNLSLVPRPGEGGALATALGPARHIRIALPLPPPPAAPPAKAVSQVALGVFPTAKRLAVEIAFEHPGRTMDRYRVEWPSEFRLVSASAARPCRVAPAASERKRTTLEIVPSAPQRDRTSFSLEGEAPLPGGTGLQALSCAMPLPQAGNRLASLTLLAVPTAGASLRGAAALPKEKPFVPASWEGTAGIASSVRLPAPDATVWVDFHPANGRPELSLEQLCVAGNGRAEAFSLAQFRAAAPWPRIELLLHPALRVRNVSGPSLLDWSQAGDRLIVRTGAAPEPVRSFLLALDWDPVALAGEVPSPLLTAAEFATGETSTLLAVEPNCQVLHAMPGGPGLEAHPFRLEPPLQVRARLDPTPPPGQPAPRVAPVPPVFRSSMVVSVGLQPDQVQLDAGIELEPQDSALEALGLRLPGRMPNLRWSGPLLREVRMEGVNGSEVHTLIFRGPVHQPARVTGSATLPLPAAGLRLPVPTVSGSEAQRRFLVVHSAHLDGWSLQPENLREVPLHDLPFRPARSGSARAFAATSEAASLLVVSPNPSASAAAPVHPAVLDLHLATTLRRNGDSAHLAQAWILLPPEDILEVELPAGAVPVAARLNGQPAATRPLTPAGEQAPRIAVALEPGLSRAVPSHLELEYDCLSGALETAGGQRIPFRLAAPRLGSLPVSQTAWQVRPLEGFALHTGDGNVYEMQAGEFRRDRFASLTGLARDLKRSLEAPAQERGEASLIRNRILALTSFANSAWPGNDLVSTLEEARQLRESARAGPAAAAAPSTALTGSWAAVDRAFGADGPEGPQIPRPFRDSSPAPGPPKEPGRFIPLAEGVAIDARAAPWVKPLLATAGNRPAGSAPAAADRGSPQAAAPAPQRPLQPRAASAAGTLFSVPLEFPPSASGALFFKKLRADARLVLIATPRTDPGLIRVWLGFGAALAAFALLERLFGRPRRRFR